MDWIGKSKNHLHMLTIAFHLLIKAIVIISMCVLQDAISSRVLAINHLCDIISIALGCYIRTVFVKQWNNIYTMQTVKEQLRR